MPSAPRGEPYSHSPAAALAREPYSHLSSAMPVLEPYSDLPAAPPLDAMPPPPTWFPGNSLVEPVAPCSETVRMRNDRTPIFEEPPPEVEIQPTFTTFSTPWKVEVVENASDFGPLADILDDAEAQSDAPPGLSSDALATQPWKVQTVDSLAGFAPSVADSDDEMSQASQPDLSRGLPEMRGFKQHYKFQTFESLPELDNEEDAANMSWIAPPPSGEGVSQSWKVKTIDSLMGYAPSAAGSESSRGHMSDIRFGSRPIRTIQTYDSLPGFAPSMQSEDEIPRLHAPPGLGRDRDVTFALGSGSSVQDQTQDFRVTVRNTFLDCSAPQTNHWSMKAHTYNDLPGLF